MNFKAHHSINPSVFGLVYGCLYSLSSWLWSYGSWIYNYLCNRCLSSLMLWVRISIRARCKTLCDEVCQWLATGQWVSPGPLVSSTNKTDHRLWVFIFTLSILLLLKQLRPDVLQISSL